MLDERPPIEFHCKLILWIVKNKHSAINFPINFFFAAGIHLWKEQKHKNPHWYDIAEFLCEKNPIFYTIFNICAYFCHRAVHFKILKFKIFGFVGFGSVPSNRFEQTCTHCVCIFVYIRYLFIFISMCLSLLVRQSALFCLNKFSFMWLDAAIQIAIYIPYIYNTEFELLTGNIQRVALGCAVPCNLQCARL